MGAQGDRIMPKTLIRSTLATLALILLGVSLAGCVYYPGYGGGYYAPPGYGGGHWHGHDDDDDD
jgi:hypothetical protein